MRIIFAVLLFLLVSSPVLAQTKPTQAERDKWTRDVNARILESAPCKEVTWLLEQEKQPSITFPPIRYSLGWWDRGFIEGAVYMIPGDKAQEAAGDFGLSVR